jgi:predicted lipoprotein with Yx(FWY)xxD motif
MFASLSTRARRALVVGVLSGAGLVVAAACSSGTASRTAATAPPATTAPATATQATSHSVATIAVGHSSLGTIVVDNAGRTLYRFDKDTPGSGSSACNGACAAAWPPALAAGAPTVGPGVTGTLGVITRTDGSHQVTLDGHPLYRYAGDQGPGDTTGDGFGGIWHILRSATSTSSAGASTGGSSTPW